MGGRIWARAFLDISFQKLLEENLRDATTAFFLERVNPLFAYTAASSVAFFTELATFTPAEQQQIRDGVFDTTAAKYISLRAKLTGNGFTILRGAATPLPTLRNDIDGPQGPNLPLTRNEWVRVYAKAHLDPAGYKERLRRSPAEAIDEFSALGHNSGAPIFKFPTITQLLAVIPAADPLKNQATLEQTLHRIANATDPACEANLEITLTC
jgi:hypothetical protein